MQNKSSIVLNMNLNASGFARGIKSVIGSVKNMNESMKDATNSASKMSSVMKGIGSSAIKVGKGLAVDRKSTRLNSSHNRESRMPSSA